MGSNRPVFAQRCRRQRHPVTRGASGPVKSRVDDVSLACRVDCTLDHLRQTIQVAAALSQCSLYQVTSQTQNAMNTAVASVSTPSDKASLALCLAIASPEFALS